MAFVSLAVTGLLLGVLALGAEATTYSAGQKAHIGCSGFGWTGQMDTSTERAETFEGSSCTDQTVWVRIGYSNGGAVQTTAWRSDNGWAIWGAPAGYQIVWSEHKACQISHGGCSTTYHLP